MSTLVAVDDRSSSASAARGSRWTARWNLAVVLLSAAFLGLAGWQRRWIADDALIALRTVEQLLAGNGPVFNIGERVEANTSTAWTYLLAAIGWVTGEDLELIAVAIGLGCTVAGVAFAVDATRRMGDVSVPVVPVGVLVVLALPPFWDFATSGLETGLVVLWIGLSWWLLVLRAGLGAMVVFGLAPLVRPELAMAVPLFAGVLLALHRPGRRRAAVWVAAGLALPVAYQIFRMGYYGLLVPNTALAKEASQSEWARGLVYLADTFGIYQLWVPALLLGLAAPRFTNRLWLAPVGSGLLLIGYVTKVGGDFMHGRMLLPALLLILLPVLVLPLSRTVGRIGLGMLAWAVVCALWLSVPYPGMIGPLGIADERGFYLNAAQDPNPTTAEAYLRHKPELIALRASSGLNITGQPPVPLRADTGARLAVTGSLLGVTGAAFPLDVLVVDELGLAHAVGSHMVRPCGGRAGHEKRLPNEWFYADYMDPAVILPDSVLKQQVDRVRAVLTTGSLGELREATRAPMSAARFWDNLVGSAARTTFRFRAVETNCP